MPDDLWRWSACNLAKAVREKPVSSREVVEAHLDRIATVNSAVNAITVVFADEALAAADAANYRDAIAERHRIASAWNHLMTRYPLILAPVSSMEAFQVGYDAGGVEPMRRLIRSMRMTELCNLLGLPSIALSTTIENGAPHGVQIIARRFDEDRCFAAAETIEDRCRLPTPIDPTTLT